MENGDIFCIVREIGWMVVAGAGRVSRSRVYVSGVRTTRCTVSLLYCWATDTTVTTASIHKPKKYMNTSSMKQGVWASAKQPPVLVWFLESIHHSSRWKTCLTTFCFFKNRQEFFCTHFASFCAEFHTRSVVVVDRSAITWQQRVLFQSTNGIFLSQQIR